MREKLNTLPLAELKELAKAQGIKGASVMRKADLVELLCQTADKSDRTDKNEEKDKDKEKAAQPVRTYQPRNNRQENGNREGAVRSSQTETAPQEELSELDSGLEANGILEVMADGFGFIRCENFLPGENDVYVAPSQIRRFNMKTGDIVRGNRRVKAPTEKFAALLICYVHQWISGCQRRAPSQF